MAVTLTLHEQEFLARSSATIAAMDQSKVKNKTIEDDSSKQYKSNKKRQGRRGGSVGSIPLMTLAELIFPRFKMSHPGAKLECTND